MSGRMPKHINPLRLVQTGEVLRGCIPLVEMPRIASAVLDSTVMVDVLLQFGRDDQGIPGIIGHIKAEVRLQCLRCLGPMVLPLELEVTLGIAADEAMAAQLPEFYDPLVVNEESVSLAALVEDELILALPIVARHEDVHCNGAQELALEPESDGECGENPFGVLAQLKQRQ